MSSTNANTHVGITGASHVEHVMGMAISIDIRDDIPADRAAVIIGAAVRWFHDVDAVWSTWRSDSIITRFARGELMADALPSEMHEVLDLCELISAETGGAFDIHIPAPNGTMLEPSGLVKGWCVERAAAIIESYGVDNFIVNAGGDVAARGESRPGTPWTIGIRHPEFADQIAMAIRSDGHTAVATSGAYERGEHIIDPRTGLAAREFASVTIVGPDLTLADAWATAVFVMGVAGLAWIAENHPEYAAFAVTHDARTLATASFDRYRAQ